MSDKDRPAVGVETVGMTKIFGSLTALDRHDGKWWAVFAHYDGKGGEPGRDHRYTMLARRYHPDINQGDRSMEKRLQAVVEAYQLLRKSALFA